MNPQMNQQMNVPNWQPYPPTFYGNNMGFFPYNQQQTPMNNQQPVGNQSQGSKVLFDVVSNIDEATKRPMPANGIGFFLNEDESILYLVTTGYVPLDKNVKAFRIVLMEDEKPDYSEFEKRLTRLEEIADAKSDTSGTKSKK